MSTVGEPSILIIHPERRTQRIVQRILGTTGYRIDIADSADQGVHLLEHLSPVLVVVDGALVESGTSALLAAAKARGTEACMTLFGPRAASRVPVILGLGAVTNLLVHPMPALAEELTITAQKLIRGDLFGAEKYLLWGSQLEEIAIVRASQRAEIVGQLAEKVRARGQSARIASMAMLVTDELISNAVHNAPVDAAGEHYRKDLPRDAELALDERHQVRLRWGCDARFVAVEVTDRFGSLDRDTILNALARHDVRDSGGGAGMGLALAYGSCHHLIFNLAPGVRTEVIALIDIRPAANERTVASSYNVFVEKPRAP